MKTSKLCLAATLLVVMSPGLSSQMEKRDGQFYDSETIKALPPAYGTRAPDLVLNDLDGKPHSLSSFKGRTVVLVKGGYT